MRVGPAPERDAVEIAIDPVRSFDEVRALWVVRFTMTSEESVLAMIERADRAGINTLLVQVRGRADAFYESELEPRGEAMQASEGFDPLALTIEEAHRRGMAVHAWVNTHLVWGPTERPQSEDHLVNRHPDWLAVPRELGRELVAVDPFDPRFVDRLVAHALQNDHAVEGIYSSPSHPSVQDRVHRVWLDLARRYDLDGIHFDYIRFPSADYDYSLGALERFRLWVRGSLASARFAELDRAYGTDLYAFVDGEPERWDDFRREQVTRLVQRVYADVKTVKPRLVVSAAVIADTELAFDDRFQDWPGWLRTGMLDIAVPMAYTPDPELFASLIDDARTAAGEPARVWAGIGAYMNTTDGTLRMIDLARSRGAGGIVLFSYDWAVGDGQGDPRDPFLQRVGRARFAR
ncbi:MAG: family 10 glycosylhydrolase [Gemmatimonadota bacterium]|nr:family 10 glycosylhydrolase [Gemmatimonadota bacterium]